MCITLASAPKVDALDQNEYELLNARGSKEADGEEARDKSKRGRARTAKVAPLGVIGQHEEDLAVVNAEVAALHEVGRGASVATLESARGWAVSLSPEVGVGARAESAASQVVVALRAQNAEAMATIATLGQAVGDGEAEAAAAEDERDAVLEEVALLRAELQAASRLAVRKMQALGGANLVVCSLALPGLLRRAVKLAR